MTGKATFEARRRGVLFGRFVADELRKAADDEMMGSQNMRRPLPCFKCAKSLEPVMPDDSDRNQPYDAVVFTTHGQYGSSVFDEFDGAKLAINICDECLVQHKDTVLHLDGVPRRQWKPWAPEAAPPVEQAKTDLDQG